MHKKLIIAAFDKARNKLKEKGIQNPSAVKIAEELSNYVEETEDFPLGERTYRDYYNQALKEDTGDIEIRQLKVVTGLCKYAGFENYSEFKNQGLENPKEKRTRKVPPVFKKYKIALGVALVLLIAFISYTSVNKQKWMVWETDQYVEAPFDAMTLNHGELKLYNVERINQFRKIYPDCNTDFFKDDGTENLWYGKNKEGTLEYFTSLGLHPETGKTLKKITKHMIRNHICENY